MEEVIIILLRVICLTKQRCPGRGPEIHIGSFVRGMQTDVSKLAEEGFVIRTRGEDIVIVGKTPRGTVYGVYYFLEKFINFRCFTKDVETFDRIDTLIVEDLDICENPAFEYREVYFRSAFDPHVWISYFIPGQRLFIICASGNV